MLPGFRILFAIVLLSVSVLIFGLGAAAFLRSAHENIASAPLWRPIETPATARVDLAQPTLAMLRVEPEPLPTATTAKAEAAQDKPAALALAPVPETPAQTPATSPAPATAAAAPIIAPEPARDAAAPPAVTETKEAPTAPTVVAAVTPEKIDAAPAATAPQAPAAANAPIASAEAPAMAAEITEDASSPGVDTLKPDDKTIDAAPLDKIAALGEPAVNQSFANAPPLRASEVKIPHPRIDPAAREARRRQLLIQQRARARVAQARRLAVARARAAAQTQATAANPFAVPPATPGPAAN